MLTLKENRHLKRKASNVEEVAPGIVRVSDYDFVNNKLDGKERTVDYDAIGYSPVMLGPRTIAKELQSHAEYKERSTAIAIIDSDNEKLEKLFWFQGKHIFPKEYLELAVNNKEIVIIYVNQGIKDKIKDKETLENAVEYILPQSGSSYTVLDLLWIEGNIMGSFLCEGQSWCCPPEGIDLGNVDQP
jgi:hypothetical protein